MLSTQKFLTRLAYEVFGGSTIDIARLKFFQASDALYSQGCLERSLFENNDLLHVSFAIEKECIPEKEWKERIFKLGINNAEDEFDVLFYEYDNSLGGMPEPRAMVRCCEQEERMFCAKLFRHFSNRIELWDLFQTIVTAAPGASLRHLYVVAGEGMPRVSRFVFFTETFLDAVAIITAVGLTIPEVFPLNESEKSVGVQIDFSSSKMLIGLELYDDIMHPNIRHLYRLASCSPQQLVENRHPIFGIAGTTMHKLVFTNEILDVKKYLFFQPTIAVVESLPWQSSTKAYSDF